VSSSEAADLQHYWLILRRRWLPATAIFGAVITLTALSVFLQKPVYQALGKLVLSDNKTSSLTGLEDAVGSLKALTQQSSPLDTEAEAIRSDPVVLKTIAALNLRDQQRNLLEPEDFLKKFNVTNVRGTDVLQLTYKSTNPEEAAAVINQLMNFYLSGNVVTNRAQATAARKFLEKQLPTVEGKVLAAELAVRKFEEINKVADLQAQAQSVVERIGALEDQTTEAQAELAKASTQSTALQKQVGMNLQQAKAINSLSQSPAVQEALKEYQQVESELAIARAQYQDAHPTVINLKEREASLKTLLQKRAIQVVRSRAPQSEGNLQTGELQQKLTEEFVGSEIVRLGLTSQVAALSHQRSFYRQQVDALPRLKQMQRGLERKLAVVQLTYETVLRQLQEAKLAENQNLGNARVLQTARVPKIPIAPRKALLLVLGGLLGGLLAITVALILEALDTSVKTVKEARELFDYTLLGTIPTLKADRKINRSSLDRPTPKLVVRDAPRSSASEAYRMLQANFKFLSSDKPLKVIVITSSIPQEGKSTVSANLAMAMAELGQRVLLVDADTRRPSQHQIWELANATGLSNVLAGQAPIKTAIQQQASNLDILTSGVLPPNPQALLDSKRMATLVEDLSRCYDYVIIDTPPLAVAADALILGKMADGVLIVARPGVVDSASAISAKESLEQSGQNILGLAINGIIPENEPDSYYYYYAKGYYTNQDTPAPKEVTSEETETAHRS
jgi:capsular exopolysaccharide synthesis family protein